MRKFFLLFAVIILGSWGCNQQDSVLESNKHSNQSIENPNNQNIQLIPLPINLNKTRDGSSSLSLTKNINGKKGGEMQLEYSDNHFEIHASLHIPNDAFSGTEKLSMTLSDVSTVVTFGPSMIFQNPLKFDLEYDGLNLKGLDPSSIKFAYLSDSGSIIPIKYDYLVVDILHNVLKVEGARIEHFSRFGFCR